MFTQPTPSAPILGTSASLASAASPTRPSRLRGLSYLRNYTHNHLHSRENSDDSSGPRRQILTRSTSYPTPTPTSPGDRSAPQRLTTDRGDDPSSGSDAQVSTSGWLPTVGGQSGASRTGTQPQSTSAGPGTSSAQISRSNLNETARSTTMGRKRSVTTSRAAGSDGPHDTQLPNDSAPALSSYVTNGNGTENNSQNQLPSIRFSQHQDVRAPRPSLIFSAMSRTLPTGREIIRVGRYSERENGPTIAVAANIPSSSPIGFKSKVVSRRHCEFWYQDGIWFIKDVKSSSGTFLNHVRLSSPGTESKPFPIKDGDIVQLGIDFKGGEEMIFRCVKIRIELNRGWQNSLNSFNVASHKRLRNLQKKITPANSSSSQDCTICLGPVAPCQSLFVAPCSHTWHYKCVRRIINGPMWPQFVCPNCRAVADLEADVDDPFPEQDWENADELLDEQQDEAGENGARTPTGPTAQSQIPETPIANMEDTATNNHTRESTTETSTESLNGGENSLNEALHHLSFSNEAPAVSDTVESHSTVAAVDIRSGRSPSGTSNAMDIDAFGRSERTPSPNSRLPTDLMHALNGTDGPMTPRNDVGPFVFDGSGGRPSGPQLVVTNASNVSGTEVAT